MPPALRSIAWLLAAAIGSAPAARAETGHVRFVTAKRLYLDRGAAEGLRAGDKLTFLRAARAVGSCTIDEVAVHAAVCRGRGARAGDDFALPARRPAPAAVAPAPIPTPEPADAVARRARAIAVAPQRKVDFVPAPHAAYAASGSVSAGATLYASTPSGSRYVAETLDVALHHVPIGGSSFRFDTAFSLVRLQSSLTPRFRPGAGTEFYLWDAEVSRREIDSQTVIAAGRVWPWHTPGLPVLDGVQLGRRSEAGGLEAGVYSGFIPETLTLAPSLDSWTSGVYAALAQPGARGDLVRMAEEEARIAVRHSPTVGWVREAEGRGMLETGSGGLAAGVRVREAVEVDRQPALELADGEAWLRQVAGVSGRVQVRYLGVPPEQEPLLRDELPRALGGYHGSASLSWDPSRAIGFLVDGDAHHEQAGDLNEVDGRFDLHLPRLFGDLGGLWLGAAVGQGWMESRSAYAQVILAASRLRILGRFGGDVSRFVDPAGEVAVTELGGTLQLEARLSSRLRLVARTLARIPLAIAGVAPDSTLGMVSSVDLTAAY